MARKLLGYRSWMLGCISQGDNGHNEFEQGKLR
jgi:hypothetical protein